MPIIIFVIFIAILGGVAAGLQAPLVGILNERIGTLESVFLTYGGGGLLVSLVLLILSGGNLGAWRNVPWYALLGGPLGLVIVGSLSYTIPRLGVATTVTLFIVVQLIISALMDHFGLLGVSVRAFDLYRLIGIVVLFIGTWLMVR